ncbi:putative rhamnogalacturonate lyase A [Phytophthora fragariae]|nr:putative rhamnogalacturonate lyase A [Phytophthora fragariae]KAE8929209.1 putative rhamnogalacturonate lyase A [Phytophthora fragariae]KAE8990480.1 putative rhamnogalacturonate lyase A [Phytophthora fragariae]KAE9088820.1 putative rhamnogalacturonate lyase A [Phytophthora fragariae]KAE9089574.1 putative rhamnogalacturonate lyase A [Phytophthora fragariae]
MLSGRLFRAALLLTSGLLAVAQANTKQLTSNLNFQSEEERGATSSFGYKENGGSWVIDSGAGLTVKVSQRSCDITSMVWNKAELQITKKMTHINSGLGKVTSSIQELKDKTIQISCKTKGLEHTYLFRPSENAIYMGTHHTTEMQLGELRFLARLNRKPMKNPMVPASNIDGMNAIEAHDVYADSKGVSASKFYSGIPFIDDKVHGVTGDAGGVFFVMSDYAYEKSVGGPFFRDINNQCTQANELTFYMFSDHTRTEDYRYGFHGPYALVFTDGKQPAVSDVDFDFFQDLTLTGFVPEADRGSWSGAITDTNGVLSNSSVVVGFSNAEAQYWVKLNSTTGSFTSPMMIAGSYNATIYKNQLPVSSEAITITGGSGSTPAQASSSAATSTNTPAANETQSRRTQSVQNAQTLTVTFEPAAKPIWRIGEWDGTPDGFLNADKIHTAHPSDSRMEAWTPLNFTIGTDKDSVFPMAMFRAVNDPITINFQLTKEQVGDRTLKIGIPLSQSNGRCSVTVNKFSAKVPMSAAVKTRGVTRGVTVGKYMFYDYAIPKSALVEGKNQIVLGIVSGNKDTLGKWLSASVVFDALELV